MPKELSSLKIKVGSNKLVYSMGMGGLHSTEEWMHYVYDPEYMIIDRDVASYYPRIIINQRLFPKHLGANFLDIYEGIVIRRLEAKAAGDKLTANSLKIVVNGSFGKFGSCHSILFSPDLLIQTTISGQLYLLMLIERFELAGFNVISANTDGVVTRFKKERYDEFNEIVRQWESDTRFDTEETRYSQYFARDCNNYITTYPDGGGKSKGCFGKSGISKNPSGSIIYRAVQEYIQKGIDPRDTVNACTDITQFVFVRTVKGGAKDADGCSIGKVVRFYKARGEFGSLRYVTNGNKVPGSDGCLPLMELGVDFPQDVDYKFYSDAAKKILSGWFNQKTQLTMDF